MAFSRKTLIGAAFIGAMALTAPVARADGGDGSAAFDLYCMACHGADARGIDGLGVTLVGSAFVTRTPVAELVEFLKIGRLPDDPATLTGRAMPGFGWVSDSELTAVVEFLKSHSGTD
jgi:mono/diheme cytochrome c family protein